MRLIGIFGLVINLSSCQTNGSGEVTTSKTISTGLMQRVETAMASGQLRFDLRGLKNTASRSGMTSATSYLHTATIVVIGDSVLTMRPYEVMVAIRRVDGGDPESVRPPDDYSVVIVRNGVGELRESGGYRLTSERWSPEKIEARIIGVVPWLPVNGAPVVEQ